MTKRCPTCSTAKPIDEFYANRSTATGIDNECKECKKRRSREYSLRESTKQAKRNQRRDCPDVAERQRAQARASYARHKEQRQAYWKTPKGISTRTRYEASSKRRDWLNRYYASAKFRAGRRAEIANDPRRFQARWAVNNAIRDGRLAPARSLRCACGCGASAQQYHHWSYEPQDWLDVLPMTRSCHRRLHEE